MVACFAESDKKGKTVKWRRTLDAPVPGAFWLRRISWPNEDRPAVSQCAQPKCEFCVWDTAEKSQRNTGLWPFAWWHELAILVWDRACSRNR